MQQLFLENLGLNDIFIEHTERVEKRSNSENSPRIIIAKVLHYKDK